MLQEGRLSPKNNRKPTSNFTGFAKTEESKTGVCDESLGVCWKRGSQKRESPWMKMLQAARASSSVRCRMQEAPRRRHTNLPLQVQELRKKSPAPTLQEMARRPCGRHRPKRRVCAPEESRQIVKHQAPPFSSWVPKTGSKSSADDLIRPEKERQRSPATAVPHKEKHEGLLHLLRTGKCQMTDNTHSCFPQKFSDQERLISRGAGGA